MADLHKALEKHMLEATPDELEGLDAHELLDLGLGIGIGEGERVLADAHDAIIADRGAKDVGGKITQRPNAGSHRAGDDVPTSWVFSRVEKNF